MKSRGKLRLGISFGLGILAAGSIAMYGVPSIAKDVSFLLGFLACMVCVSLLLILALTRYRHSWVARTFDDNSRPEESGNPTRNNDPIWILVLAMIALGGLVSSFLIYKKKEVVEMQTLYQRTRILQESERNESIRISGMVYLMGNLFDRIDDELENSQSRILTDETIARIASLSHSFKPYTHFWGDSLSEKKLSPERGQLLLTLSKLNVDSSTIKKIMFQASFLGADLKDADLRGADLRGADLRQADMEGVDLEGAKLNEADLRTCNLWGANMTGADLRGAKCKRADLRWAVLNGADLRGANLNGAKMTSAKLRNADLRGSVVQWAGLSGAFFTEANLEGADFYGANLERAHFTIANLERANFTDANLSEANLEQANLAEAIFLRANLTGAELFGIAVAEENWPVMLNEWLVIGANEIQKSYKIVGNSKNGQPQYKLEKLAD